MHYMHTYTHTKAQSFIESGQTLHHTRFHCNLKTDFQIDTMKISLKISNIQAPTGFYQIWCT